MYYLIYDKEENPPVIEPDLQQVADYVNLTLASLRSYISKKHPIKDGSTIYKIKKVKAKQGKAREFLSRVL